MRWLRLLKLLFVLGLLGFAGLLLYFYARHHPEDLPWTELDLARPVGAFTGRKLAALPRDGERCETLLKEAGISFTPLPTRADGPQCGYRDGVRFQPGGAVTITYSPAGLDVSCPVAAGLALWEWHVVQPAALARFGRKVVRIDHFGSYSCRRLYGRDQGDWSEHATANAVDIAGFRLEDGTRVSVARDWAGAGSKSAFLHDLRDGACRLFATVLSPDYNAAHHDHLHLDQAARGAASWRVCR